MLMRILCITYVSKFNEINKQDTARNRCRQRLFHVLCLAVACLQILITSPLYLNPDQALKAYLLGEYLRGVAT